MVNCGQIEYKNLYEQPIRHPVCRIEKSRIIDPYHMVDYEL